MDSGASTACLNVAVTSELFAMICELVYLQDFVSPATETDR
jgi:hypothetical protein